jgi:hypothetical protein
MANRLSHGSGIPPEESQQDSTGAGSSGDHPPQDVYLVFIMRLFCPKKCVLSDADDHLRVVHHRLHQQLCIRIRGGSCTRRTSSASCVHDHQSGRIAESDPDMFAELPDTNSDGFAWKVLDCESITSTKQLSMQRNQT